MVDAHDERKNHRTHSSILPAGGTKIADAFKVLLSQLPNLRQMIVASAEIGRMNLVNIVTDESEDSKVIDVLL